MASRPAGAARAALGPGRGRAARDIEQILDRERHAGQRSWVAAGRHLGVDGPRRSHGLASSKTRVKAAMDGVAFR